MAKILVVEDDRTLCDALVYNLRREEHQPIVAQNGSDAIAMARQERPDLVLLDVTLPGGSGFDVCREIRRFSSSPVIMLTARGEASLQCMGLDTHSETIETGRSVLMTLPDSGLIHAG